MISFDIDSVSEVFDLKLHDIMLNQSFLLDLRHFSQVDFSQFIDQIQLVNCIFKSRFFGYKFLDNSLNDSALILQLLVACNQFLEIDVVLCLVLCQIIDFFV
jgi:hypothetical protein